MWTLFSPKCSEEKRPLVTTVSSFSPKKTGGGPGASWVVVEPTLDDEACFGSLRPLHFPQGLSVILMPLPFKTHPGMACKNPPTPCSSDYPQTSCGAWMVVDRKELIQHLSQATNSFAYQSAGGGSGGGRFNGSQPFHDQGFFSLFILSSSPPPALKVSVYQTSYIY